jgi:hypothetical protein
MGKSQAEAVIDFVQAPKLFLISRQSLAHKLEGVKEMLRMADVAGAFAASDIDALLAAELGITNIMGVNKPFILVADFPFEVAVIAEGGQVFAGSIEEKPKETVN